MQLIQSGKNIFLFMLLVSLHCICGCRTDINIQPDLTLESYIHRIHIQLYGRKADISEQIMGTIFLRSGRESQAWRRIYCEQLIRTQEFRQNQYQIARSELLNFIFTPDSVSIQETIDVWKRMYSDSIWRPEVKRLRKLQQIPRLLNTGMSYEELQKILIHNSYYDFINMGTENFVVSLYHNFLERPPTEQELKIGILLTDGGCTYFDGNLICGKENYILAFFNRKEYAEGQVRKLVRMILFREARPEEIKILGRDFMLQRDHNKIWSQLLSSEEFIKL